MNKYNIEKILEAAASGQILCAPDSEREWAKFAAAVKVWGGSFEGFKRMSWGSEKVMADKWRNAKGAQWGINSPDDAAAVIVGMAKAAGADLNSFLLPQEESRRTDLNHRATAAEDFAGIRLTDDKAASTAPPRFIGSNTVAGYESNAEQSNLFKWLCTLFPSDDVKAVFRRYRVGATPTQNGFAGHSTTFPMINAAGQIVDVKIIPYLEDGHRAKGDEIKYPVSWLLTMRKQGSRRAPWPLFGEHLLPLTSGAVGIVESEKTALIASLVTPGVVWLAVGSLNNLNPQRCTAAKVRPCVVFPDADGVEEWRKRAAALTDSGFNVFFAADLITQNAAQGSKDDLADILCREAVEGREA